MKAVLISALLVVAVSASHIRTKRDLKATLEGIRKQMQGDDWKDQIKNVYAEEVKYIKHDGGVINRDDIAKYWEDGMKEHGDFKDITATIEHLIQEGDVAIDIGKCSMTTKEKQKDGTEKDLVHHMRHMAVWKKVGDSYKIIADGTWMEDGSDHEAGHGHEHHGHGHDHGHGGHDHGHAHGGDQN